MSKLLFTRDHEYVRLDADVATVGVSDHAQSQLGDIVYVELPNVGQNVERGASIAVVESVKAASDVYAPISGEVVEINLALETSPGSVNEDPMGGGWFMKIQISDAGELKALMSEEEYRDFLKQNS